MSFAVPVSTPRGSAINTATQTKATSKDKKSKNAAADHFSMKRALVGAALVASKAAASPVPGVSGALLTSTHAASVTLPRGAQPVTPPTGPAPYMVYSEGPVIPNVRVTSVYWGPNVAFKEEINEFYAKVTNSAFMDQLHEYSSPNQTIGRGSFAGAVTLNSSLGNFLYDYQIETELTNAVASGLLPNNTNGNELFMVHFPKDTYISLGGTYSCWDFLAYHSSFLLNGTLTSYGVIPDQGGLCANDTSDTLPGGQLGQTTIAASHELAEAVTDPGVGIAFAPLGPPLGWYDPKVGEIGDVCLHQLGTVGPWNVQKVWSQQKNGCVGPGN